MPVHACPVTLIKHTFEHVSANYGGYDYVWARNDRQKTQYDAMNIGSFCKPIQRTGVSHRGEDAGTLTGAVADAFQVAV
jgi:hypothetical protein